MASHDLSQTRHTPAQYANKRAFDPVLLAVALLVLIGIVALGKMSWAEKAYESNIARYEHLR